MDEEQVRQIIQEELEDFKRIDRYTFQRLIQILDGRNIQTGRKTGTKIGTATDQKIAFFNSTPVVQQSKINDPAGQNDDLDSEARTAINAIIDALEALGFTATS